MCLVATAWSECNVIPGDLGVRVSGMIRVTVGVRVMVRVSNLLGSD